MNSAPGRSPPPWLQKGGQGVRDESEVLEAVFQLIKLYRCLPPSVPIHPQSKMKTATCWVFCLWVAVTTVASQYAAPSAKGKKHRTTTTTTENPSIGNEIAGPFPFPDAETSGATPGASPYSNPAAPNQPAPGYPNPGAPNQPAPGYPNPGAPNQPAPGYPNPGAPNQPAPGYPNPGAPNQPAPGYPNPGAPNQPAPGYPNPGAPNQPGTGYPNPGAPNQPAPGYPNPAAPNQPGPGAPSGGYWWAGPNSPFKPGAQSPSGGCYGGGCGGSPPPPSGGCAGPSGCAPVPPPPPPPPSSGCGGPGGCTGAGNSPYQPPSNSPGKPIDIENNPFLSSAILGKPVSSNPQGCQGGGCGVGPTPGTYPGAGPSQYPGGPGPNKPAGQYPGQPSGQYPSQPSGQYPGQNPGQYPTQPTGQYPNKPAGQYPGQPSAQNPGQFPTQPTNQFPGGPNSPNKPAGQYPGQPSGQYPGQPSGQYPGQPSGQNPGQFPTQPTGQYPSKPSGQYPNQPSGQNPGQYPGQPSGQYPTQPTGQYPGGPSKPTGQYPGQPSGPEDNFIYPGQKQQPPANVPLRPQCAAPGHACVPAQMCVGGVITSTGMTQIRDAKIKECIPGLEACCRIPPKTPFPGPGAVTPGYGRPTTQQPYTGPLNTTPYPGCAAALKCVPENYCTADGVMSDSPVVLTREQLDNKVPLSECFNMETGVIGKCCKDPNYKDPWPGGMMMGTAMLQPGDYDDGQYHGEGSGPYYNSISPTLQTPSKDHGPKPSDRPGGFNKPLPPFPGNTPSGSPYSPKPSPTGQYQPNQPNPSSPYQPSPTGSYQPNQPNPSSPYQPGQPSPTGSYQPNQPNPSSPYQPGQPSPTGSYQPNQPNPSSPYQPGQPSPTGSYQPNQPNPSSPYQPGQPNPSSPYQPSPTGQYQPNGPNPSSPYPSDLPTPAAPSYQPDQSGSSIPTHPGHQDSSPDQGPAPGSSCGIRRPGPDGDVAGFGEFPWQALVSSAGNRTLLCGAAIISETAVITAAHCVDQLRSQDLIVKAGEGKLLAQNPKPVQVRPVGAVSRHPSYNSASRAYDLAILTLSQPLVLDTHVDKICVPANLGSNYLPQPGQQCLITGWGKVALQGPVQGSDLHKVQATVLPAKTCEAQLKNTSLGKYFILNEGFSCAVPPSPSDLCKVDTGSAVACARPDGHYELAGVNSWDIPCPVPEPRPSVFTTSDATWINTVLNTPLPVLQAEEEEHIQSLSQGENIPGIDTDDKPGFSQGYGK